MSWVNADRSYFNVEEGVTWPTAKLFLASNPARLSERWLKDGFVSYATSRLNNAEFVQDTGMLVWSIHLYYGSPHYPSLVDASYVTGFMYDSDNDLANTGWARGDLMMADLEYRVGRPMMDNILRSWVALQRTRPVTTTDFVTNAALVSKDPGVVNLMNSWIYNSPLPTPAFVTEATTGN